MKAQVLLAAFALVAAASASAQSSPYGSAASTSSAAASYDWGQSQVQKMYQSPYARPSESDAATAERKRLTESRQEEDEKNAKNAKDAQTVAKRSSGGKLACLGMGSTINATTCHTNNQLGIGPSMYEQYQQQLEQQRHPLQQQSPY